MRDLNLHPLGPLTGQGEQNAKLSGFTWGALLSLVQVVRQGGRYFLRNGYHRAVALRRQGITHVPALILEVPEHVQIGVEEVGQFGWQHLNSDRPPVVGLLASAMTYPVQIREMMRVLTISIESALVPIEW